jgi:hypothetical protein
MCVCVFVTRRHAGAAATDGLIDPFGATTAAGAVKGKLPSDWVVRAAFPPSVRITDVVTSRVPAVSAFPHHTLF